MEKTHEDPITRHHLQCHFLGDRSVSLLDELRRGGGGAPNLPRPGLVPKSASDSVFGDGTHFVDTRRGEAFHRQNPNHPLENFGHLDDCRGPLPGLIGKTWIYPGFISADLDNELVSWFSPAMGYRSCCGGIHHCGLVRVQRLAQRNAARLDPPVATVRFLKTDTIYMITVYLSWMLYTLPSTCCCRQLR